MAVFWAVAEIHRLAEGDDQLGDAAPALHGRDARDGRPGIGNRRGVVAWAGVGVAVPLAVAGGVFVAGVGEVTGVVVGEVHRARAGRRREPARTPQNVQRYAGIAGGQVGCIAVEIDRLPVGREDRGRVRCAREQAAVVAETSDVVPLDRSRTKRLSGGAP